MTPTYLDMNALGLSNYDLNQLGFGQAKGVDLTGWDVAPGKNGGGFLSGVFGDKGLLPTLLDVGQLAIGGLSAWNGMNMVDLARRQLGFAERTANANLNNSVENYYNAIKNANRVGYALQGSYAKKAYGADSQELAATKAAEEATKNLTRHV